MGGLLGTLGRIGPARLLLIAAVGAGLIGFFFYVATRLTEPDYGLLFGDLDLKDSAQVAAKLDTLNVPYQVRGNGAAIYAPVDQVARLRLTMAELGVPRGNGSIGFEIFDKSDTLGSTTFQQGINELRALEGELARTIQSLSAIDSARVHLVMPKRELFTREQQPPSASIVLHTRRSDVLSKPQVTAILNLVATAVPGLKTSHISIVDQNGTLLAKGGGAEPDLAAANADEERTAYEGRLARSVEDMLERSLGAGRVRVDVNAEMDFDRQTSSQESYDPDGQVVRSTQTTKELNDNSQPADNAVSVQTNLPNGQTPPPAGSGAKSHDSKTEETTNFEISKKTVSQSREGGVVKRLSVAVLVDGAWATNDKGERSWQARSADELQTLTRLVKSAVGFDEKRGDRVEVVNMKFAEPEELPAAPSTAIFMGLEKSDLFRIGEIAGAFLVALLVIFMVLRPLVKRSFRDAKELAATAHKMVHGPAIAQGALPAPDGSGGMVMAGGTGTALVPAGEADDNMIDIGRVEGRVRASSMRKIGEIVEKHPEQAVSILRNWMYQT